MLLEDPNKKFLLTSYSQKREGQGKHNINKAEAYELVIYSDSLERIRIIRIVTGNRNN